jgi:hypothetical protein
MTQMKTSFTVTVSFDVPEDKIDNAWIHAQNIEQMMHKHLDNCLTEQKASDNEHSTMKWWNLTAHHSTQTIPSGYGSSVVSLLGTTFDTMFRDWNNHIRHYATNLTTLSDECRNQIATYGETNNYGNKVLPELTRDDLLKMWRNYRQNVFNAVGNVLTNTLIEQVAKDLEGRYEDGLIDEPKPVDKANGKVEDLPVGQMPRASVTFNGLSATFNRLLSTDERLREELEYQQNNTNIITVGRLATPEQEGYDYNELRERISRTVPTQDPF